MATASKDKPTCAENASLERVTCVVNTKEFTFNWTIDNFLQRCGNEIESSTFCTGFNNVTYWKFIVSPKNFGNGDQYQDTDNSNSETPKEYSAKYISVHLKMVSGESFFGRMALLSINGEKSDLKIRILDRFQCGKTYGEEMFLFYSEMLDTKKNILSKSGSLTIQCLLTYSENDSTTYAPYMNKRLKLSFDMESLIGSKKFSDVDIITKGYKFPAHKVILCSRSEYFMNMFKHDTLENRTNCVELDMNIETTQEFLHYLYTGSINPFSLEVAEALYVAADMYLLDDLKSICSEYFIQCLSKETVFRLLSLSDKCNETILKERALNFISTDVEAMVQSVEWLEFVTKHPHLMADIILHVFNYRKALDQNYSMSPSPPCSPLGGYFYGQASH